MRGTHRSWLQTGGRKEARFSSTQAFTLTGLSMASQEPRSRAVSSAPSEGRASARPPIGRLVNQHPEGQRAGQPPVTRCGHSPTLVWSPLALRAAWPSLAAQPGRPAHPRRSGAPDPGVTGSRIFLVPCPQTFRLGPRETPKKSCKGGKEGL